jgi:hypothetical protein
MMMTTKDVPEILKKPWWTLIKNEVARAVVLRARMDDPDMRPHGSVLGQMFIEEMNVLPELRGYFHYLTTRGWSEVLGDIGADLSPEMAKALGHEQGAAWFAEFQKFLVIAWKNSTGEGPSLPDPFEAFDRARFTAFKKEWLLHLERGAGSAALANLMLEWMRDPDDTVLRQSAVAAFAFISVRSWSEVLRALEARFGEDLREMETPRASAFFERFKGMVKRSVEDYWDGFMKEKKEAS